MAAMSETTPEARLLVVEDEPNILELLSASLRLAGFEVATATGGLEAIQAVQRHRPDLVVLDVMLPGLDGFDVARRLRSGGTRTPVLFLTARDATEDKVRGLSIGGEDYVTKPFSLEEVIARIRAVLRRVRSLVGMGATGLWEVRRHPLLRWWLAGTVAVTAVWSYVLVRRTPDWHPGLAPLVLVAGWWWPG